MGLAEFFMDNSRAAVAFSGGCDSAYLLYAAKKCGAQVHAYYVKSQFQPAFELEDALRLADELDADITVIEKDILSCTGAVSNRSDRCYHCKKEIFGTIKKAALADGFSLLLDGTNASDDISDRPGTRAAAELLVRSPLRECGLTKDMIRELSHKAGLFTWDKPAYACLATRIMTGECITAEKLTAVEKSEEYLYSLGFSDLRVRVSDSHARIQLKRSQHEMYYNHEKEICEELGRYFDFSELDREITR